MLSILVDSSNLCIPSLKLAKSLVMSGICLGMFCSKLGLFAKSIKMPNFYFSKLKVRLDSSHRVCVVAD